MFSYADIDWRQAWIDYNKARKAPGNQEFWDGRAREFARKAGLSPYSERFIELLAPEPGASVLDVGCGGGTLALPLVGRGHDVHAVDFSPAMIAALIQLAKREHIMNLSATVLDFNAPWEDWEAAGIGEKSVDIAIASRSIMVDDLWGAFEKLERAARSKVAITIPTEYGPRETHFLGELNADGLSHVPEYIFATNILMARGRHPELHYIDSSKPGKSDPPRIAHWAFLMWTPR
jgi:SAM-dependent methyltransferase